MTYSYMAQKQVDNGVEARLSAQWDTHRDAALAAKRQYNLSQHQFDILVAGGRVIKRRTEIVVQPNK